MKPTPKPKAVHYEVHPDGTRTPVQHSHANDLPPGKPKPVKKVQR